VMLRYRNLLRVEQLFRQTKLAPRPAVGYPVKSRPRAHCSLAFLGRQIRKNSAR